MNQNTRVWTLLKKNDSCTRVGIYVVRFKHLFTALHQCCFFTKTNALIDVVHIFGKNCHEMVCCVERGIFTTDLAGSSTNEGIVIAMDSWPVRQQICYQIVLVLTMVYQSATFHNVRLAFCVNNFVILPRNVHAAMFAKLYSKSLKTLKTILLLRHCNTFTDGCQSQYHVIIDNIITNVVITCLQGGLIWQLLLGSSSSRSFPWTNHKFYRPGLPLSKDLTF